MMVYSANKCSDDLANKKVDDMTYPFEHRIPSWLHELTQAFPYYTTSHLYWHLHAPLMLLSAAGMAMAFGPLSRSSCVLFTVLKGILTLQDQTNYNNHEYLYALIALVLGLLGGHDASLSFLGKAAMNAVTHSSYGQDEDEDFRGEAEGSTAVWASLSLSLAGALYMALHNVVYGVAGHIAWVGVCFLVWPGAVLLLGRRPAPGHGCHKSAPAVNKVLRRKHMSASTAACGYADTNQDASINSTETAKEHRPSERPVPTMATIPYWHVLFLRLFFSAIYLFAGFAKTDFDWCSGLTVGELFRLWAGPSVLPRLRDAILRTSSGSGDRLSSLVIGALAYGGLCLDLGCAILLNVSHRSTKMLATLAVSTFHLLNHTNFVIETFPWVMLSALAVHHDAEWIDYACAAVHAFLYKFMHLRELAGVTLRVCTRLLVPVLSILMLLHLAVPLPCALYTVMDDGALVWGSQCSFFRWRMMTRSVRTISSHLRFQDPHTGRVDDVPLISAALYPDVARVRECTTSSSLERYGFERNQALNRFLQEAGSYEDRVAHVVADALARVTPAVPDMVGAAPQIYADVWIEINGPPVQRYIDSAVDLASKNVRLVSSPSAQSVDTIFQSIAGYFSRPEPLFPWVLPRLLEFRSPDWVQRYRILKGLVARKHAEMTHLERFASAAASAGTGTGTDSHANEVDSPAGADSYGSAHAPPLPLPQVMFLADHCNKGLLRIDSRYHADDDSNATLELVLLAGTADIVNLDELIRVTAGACIKVQGALSLQTVCSSVNQTKHAPSLWMIVAHTATELAHGGSRVIGSGGPQNALSNPEQPKWLAVGYSNATADDSGKTANTFNYCIPIPVV